MLDCKIEQCRAIFARGPVMIDHLCEDCKKHLDTVVHSLNKLRLPHDIDPFLVRGLDYYTKTVFEVTARGLGSQDAIAGGGRYDNLVEQFGGKPTPALGFGSGQNRIIATMEAQNIKFPDPPSIQIYIACLSERAASEAFEISYLLRQKGIPTEMSLEGRSLRSQMKTADKLGVRYAIIIGDDEINQGAVILRNMADGQQESVDIQRIVASVEDKI